MSTHDEEVARLARLVLGGLQARVATLGKAPPGVDDARSLRASYRLSLVRDQDMRRAFMPGVNEDGTSVLYLRRGIRYRTEWFATFHACARHEIGPHPLEELVADVVAFAILAPSVDGVEVRGPHIRKATDALRDDCGPDWIRDRVMGEVLGPLAALRRMPHCTVGDLVQALRVDPISPARLLEMAREARTKGDHDQAQHWFRRVVDTAEQCGDAPLVIDALLALAISYTRVKAFRAARAAILRAYCKAKRHRLQRLLADAAHEMVALAIFSGDARRVRRFGVRAVRAYGRGEDQAVHVANDMAAHWIRLGQYQEAACVLAALVRCRVKDASARALIWANAALAFAATGNLDGYCRYARLANGVADGRLPVDVSVVVLESLSHAALFTGDVRTAERLLERAELLVTGRQEDQFVEEIRRARERMEEFARTGVGPCRVDPVWNADSPVAETVAAEISAHDAYNRGATPPPVAGWPAAPQ